MEDNEENRMLFKLYLKNTDHIVELAENGKIGIVKFQAGRYDLVFMDIEMPEVDGYAATRRIRRWEEENGRRAVPIIALTAHALLGHNEKSIAAGCSAHVTKPLKKSRLLEVIQQFGCHEPTPAVRK